MIMIMIMNPAGSEKPWDRNSNSPFPLAMPFGFADLRDFDTTKLKILSGSNQEPIKG
jgi:hypothetical protein